MTLTALLLTGGQSRRMGRDKATLMVGNQPLWSRQLALLQALQPDAIRLSARIRPEWCPPDLKVILDSPPSRGPLSGIAAALRALSTSHLFALAIDLPRMTPQLPVRLWKLSQPGLGVIPVHDRGWEPLCAVYPVEARAKVEQALKSSDLSLRSVANALISERVLLPYPVSPAEEPLFHNLNTPADLVSLR